MNRYQISFSQRIGYENSGLERQAVVYFAESDAFYLNVVGRIGFLDHLRIALIDHDQEFYLSHHDDD